MLIDSKSNDPAIRLAPQLEYQIISEMVEFLIERLDMLSGECDLEDDDPAGGNVDDIGEEEAYDHSRYFYDEMNHRLLFDDYTDRHIHLHAA